MIVTTGKPKETPQTAICGVSPCVGLNIISFLPRHIIAYAKIDCNIHFALISKYQSSNSSSNSSGNAFFSISFSFYRCSFLLFNISFCVLSAVTCCKMSLRYCASSFEIVTTNINLAFLICHCFYSTKNY